MGRRARGVPAPPRRPGRPGRGSGAARHGPGSRRWRDFLSRSTGASETLSADYVVVGAGSSGCVLAARLSERSGASVLLLEAGGPDRRTEIHVPAAFGKLFESDVDWRYRTEPQAGLGQRRLYWPRGRVLGGSSSMNAQMWVRGGAVDYDAWEAAGAAGWGWAGVLRYFRRAEQTQRAGSELLGSGGPVRVSELRDPNPLTHRFVRACQQAGIPRNPNVNGITQDGVDYSQVTQVRGKRCSSAAAYLKPALGRANLRVLTGAQATGIELAGDRATGVRFRHEGRERLASARSEVVLCGGSVNTPQLLLVSGIGPAAELSALGIRVAQDLPGVGRNLSDHLVVAVILACRDPRTLVAAESPLQLLKYLVLRRGMLTSNVAEAFAFVRTRAELPGPDLELIWAPVPYMDHGLTAPPGHGITIAPILLQPRSRGSVTLASADPLEPPRIDPRYLSEPGDLELMVEGVRRAMEIYRAPALAEVTGEPIEPATLELDDAGLARFVREQAETLYHPVGTCRMGSDDSAVVDPELRVRGVRGLRVADASVMPSLIRGHTHAPTVMIGERAASLLLGEAVPPAPR